MYNAGENEYYQWSITICSTNLRTVDFNKNKFCVHLNPNLASSYEGTIVHLLFVITHETSCHIKYEANLNTGSWEEDFSRFSQFYPIFYPHRAARGDNSIYVATLKWLPKGMLPVKFGWNQPSDSWEQVV